MFSLTKRDIDEYIDWLSFEGIWRKEKENCITDKAHVRA